MMWYCVAQRRRHPVPVAAMVAPAVDQQQRRRGRVAPVHVVQPQPLREIDAGGGTGCVHAASLRFLSRKAIARVAAAGGASPRSDR